MDIGGRKVRKEGLEGGIMKDREGRRHRKEASEDREEEVREGQKERGKGEGGRGLATPLTMMKVSCLSGQ